MKTVLLPLMLLLIVCVFCACGKNKTRLEEVGDNGYTVSVRFEANGGEFTTNCYSIVDSYNISGMKTNANGMVELALVSPDNAVRGANDTFTAQNAGYFLAGWYERVETVDSEGNTTYTYTNKWDFENGKLLVDPNKEYSVSEAVITLYAVWVPQFEINFYNMNTGELIETKIFNPEETSFQVPHWDETTGQMKMYKFPKLNGYTFNGVYLDAAGTQPVEDTLVHHGYVDEETGAAVNPSMDVYIDWMEGDWYHIYTAEQLANNASTKGNYILEADLDFSNVVWPAAFYNNKEFVGSINGNGHTISNVTIEQSKIDTMTMGLFAKIDENAVIENVTFENVILKIKMGFKTAGSAYGLFAGSIDKGATINGVNLLNSQIQISSNAAFMTQDYVLGLACASGNASLINFENCTVIELKTQEDAADRFQITVDENGAVTVEEIEA